MSIKTHCPRCKRLLSVPDKKADGYVHCPSCHGRLWVSKETATESDPVDVLAPVAGAAAASKLESAAALAAPLAQPPLPPPASPKTIAKLTTLPPSAAPPPLPSPVPPPFATPPPAPARAARKVARFISAETAQSALQLADDGKLPELSLQEGDGNPESQEKSRSLNPLVLLGALSLSVVLSMSLVLIDTDADSSGRAEEAQARQVIEEEFFGSLNPDAPLEPYQLALREAQRAHTRGDLKAERKLLHHVLDRLRAERKWTDRGLTGSREKDRKLEKQISILLSEH
jgi:hypothetical protein